MPSTVPPLTAPAPLVNQAALGLRPVLLALLVALGGCGRAGQGPNIADARIQRQANKPISAPIATPLADDSAAQIEPREPQQVARLESLLKRGEFEGFVEAALGAQDLQPANAAGELLKVEALLATGRSRDAEAVAQSAARLALDAEDYDLAAQCLKRFAVARFREGQGLEGPTFDKLAARFPRHDPTIHVLRFWSEAIGQRAPYALSTPSGEPREMALAQNALGGSHDLNAISAHVNGVPLDTVFIDSGAQHVLLSTETAAAAGVRLGPSGLRLVGFANLAARPGLLDTLELGGIVLRDVPVLVGDSAPLAAAGGQMALGTELMHHVRFTIDYPAHRVLVEPAGMAQRDVSDAWRIPLWTFSQACLAQGRLPSGGKARVLVDTGNRGGTYVSNRWARRHVPGFSSPGAPIVFKHARHVPALAKMELGTDGLSDWPVVDALPSELERADAVDVLVGRDLLAPYRVTIDMRGRVLRLRGGSATPEGGRDAVQQARANAAPGADGN